MGFKIIEKRFQKY